MTVFRPRIAILASYPVWLLEGSPLPAYGGHYATWLAALGEAFRSHQDFDVHWLTFSKAVREAVHLERMGQHFHILPRTKQTVGLYSFYLYERWMTARELKYLQPDLVHSWGNEDCYALCGSDFKGRKLLSVQGALRAYRQRAQIGSFLSRQSFYEPLTVRAHRWITTESPWAEDCIRRLSTTPQFFHWEYAVEKRFFSLSRQPLPQPSCLYAGTDSPIKNVNLLIEAFSRPELSHVQLRLAGIWPGCRPNLPPNITALGRISREQMVQELASTWCLVHPSLADTGPTIVKEARVMGVPVVLSDSCGSKQHVVDGQSGFILSPYDVNAFVRAILTVTRDAQTSLRMGQHGLETCRHELSEDFMYNSLKRIYTTILQS